jgi:hypothetical protein
MVSKWFNIDVLPFSLSFDVDILTFLLSKGLATLKKWAFFNILVTLVENFSTSKVKLGCRDF